MTDETEVYTVLRLIDQATDRGWDEELSPPGTRDEDDQIRRDLVQERIAAALGALVYLVLRRDEDLWREWERF